MKFVPGTMDTNHSLSSVIHVLINEPVHLILSSLRVGGKILAYKTKVKVFGVYTGTSFQSIGDKPRLSFVSFHQLFSSGLCNTHRYIHTIISMVTPINFAVRFKPKWWPKTCTLYKHIVFIFFWLLWVIPYKWCAHLPSCWLDKKVRLRSSQGPLSELRSEWQSVGGKRHTVTTLCLLVGLTNCLQVSATKSGCTAVLWE